MGGLGLIVPDIHERIEKLDAILAHYLKTVAWVLFLGDYFDSWTRSPATTRLTVSWLNAAVHDPRFTLLLGNHDLHYLWPGVPGLRCSGFHLESYDIVQKELDLRTKWKLQDPTGRVLVERHGWLFSHAGLRMDLLPKSVQVAPALELTPWVTAEEQWLYRQLAKGHWSSSLLVCGRERGGVAQVGGPLWLGWEAFQDDLRLPPQCVGHTEVTLPHYRGRSLNLDTSLRYVGLLDPNGVLRVEPTNGIPGV